MWYYIDFCLQKQTFCRQVQQKIHTKSLDMLSCTTVMHFMNFNCDTLMSTAII